MPTPMPDRISNKTKTAMATVILKLRYLFGLGGDNWFCGKYGGGLFIKLFLSNLSICIKINYSQNIDANEFVFGNPLTRSFTSIILFI
jgi:hypothetical protein